MPEIVPITGPHWSNSAVDVDVQGTPTLDRVNDIIKPIFKLDGEFSFKLGMDSFLAFKRIGLAHLCAWHFDYSNPDFIHTPFGPAGFSLCKKLDDGAVIISRDGKELVKIQNLRKILV